MPSSDNTSIVIILGAILLISLFYIFSSKPIHNEGALQRKNNNSVNSNDAESVDSNDSESDVTSYVSDDSSAEQPNVRIPVEKIQADEDDSADSSLEIIRERAMGLNGPYFRRKNGDRYKHNSYRALGAGKDLKQIDRQFKVSDVTKNYTDRFEPIDESDGNNAPIDIKDIKGKEKDKYNVNSFLPQQKEKDWFETIETVDVKNSHLINIYRPIGANTIGNTHKGAIYDIRGLDKAVCPKFVVSPWLQSSWEPDRSSKSLCA